MCPEYVQVARIELEPAAWHKKGARDPAGCEPDYATAGGQSVFHNIHVGHCHCLLMIANLLFKSGKARNVKLASRGRYDAVLFATRDEDHVQSPWTMHAFYP